MCSPIYQFENVLFVEIHYVGFKKNVVFHTSLYGHEKSPLLCGISYVHHTVYHIDDLLIEGE